jgi:hypothetical protein
MSDLMWLALFGHLAGDFLFQSKKMALTKSGPGWVSVFWCTFHVSVYTLCVIMFWQTFEPAVAAAVFIPHWIIDRWSLGQYWLKFIRGRTFAGALESTGPVRDFDVAFTSIVYTVVDNSIHLYCLWAVVNFMLLR